MSNRLINLSKDEQLKLLIIATVGLMASHAMADEVQPVSTQQVQAKAVQSKNVKPVPVELTGFFPTLPDIVPTGKPDKTKVQNV